MGGALLSLAKAGGCAAILRFDAAREYGLIAMGQLLRGVVILQLERMTSKAHAAGKDDTIKVPVFLGNTFDPSAIYRASKGVDHGIN